MDGLIGEPLDQMATKNRGQALERLVACLLGYKISDAELLEGNFPDIPMSFFDKYQGKALYNPEKESSGSTPKASATATSKSVSYFLIAFSSVSADTSFFIKSTILLECIGCLSGIGYFSTY